jgi:NitT/TauT family transport system substrate-binding protein
MTLTLTENFRAVFYTPFYAAFALRAFDAEELKVELKTSTAAEKTLQTLASGEAQVSWGGPMRLMIALDADPRAAVVAFCEVVCRDPFFLLGRAPRPAFRVEDLATATLATVSEVPTPWMCLQHDLRAAGVDPASIRRIPDRTMAQNADALAAGEVDVIQVFEPFATRLVSAGAGHIWHAAAARGPTSYTTLNTTRAFLEQNPDTALRMTRAMYRTQKWIAAHDGADLAQAVETYFPDLPRAVLAECCNRYRAAGIWNREPVPNRAGVEWLRDAFLSGGMIRTRFAYEDCVEPRFAEQAVREDPPAPGAA